MGEVIARIIRNTRVQDTSYLFDINEWVPEAMGLMQTKTTLITKYKDICVKFHKEKLPCDLHHIKSVESEYGRMDEVSSTKEVSTNQDFSGAGPDTFVSTLQPTSNAATQEVLWEPKFTKPSAGSSKTGTYEVEMGYISTSFADGWIRVHYAAIPTDEKGLPLIPDNENYKQALYYYVRAMMIGCGYVDTTFTWETLMGMFEKYAARAIGEIRYPSVDSMQTKLNMVRFIPQENYFDNYFRSTPEGNF